MLICTYVYTCDGFTFSLWNLFINGWEIIQHNHAWCWIRSGMKVLGYRRNMPLIKAAFKVYAIINPKLVDSVISCGKTPSAITGSGPLAEPEVYVGGVKCQRDYLNLPEGGTSNGAVILEVLNCFVYDDVIKWKHFPRHWPFVRGIHRSPVNSPHKGLWRGASMFLWSAS